MKLNRNIGNNETLTTNHKNVTILRILFENWKAEYLVKEHCTGKNLRKSEKNNRPLRECPTSRPIAPVFQHSIISNGKETCETRTLGGPTQTVWTTVFVILYPQLHTAGWLKNMPVAVSTKIWCVFKFDKNDPFQSRMSLSILWNLLVL